MGNRELKIGELVFYFKRLGTIVEINTAGARLGVEVEDDGGIVRTFAVVDPWLLQPLPNQELGILDVLHGVTRPDLTRAEQLERIAEKWFAAPQVGDVFERRNSMRLEITELGTDGVIYAQTHHPVSTEVSAAGDAIAFKDAMALRQCFQLKTKPGYALMPYATRRPDYRDHPLLAPPWK